MIWGFRIESIPSFAIRAIWFLKSLFICYLIYYAVSKCGRFSYWALGLSVAVCITLPNEYFQLDIMYPSFIFGTILNRRYDWFRAHQKILFIVSASIFLLSFFTAIQSLIHDNFNHTIDYLHKGILFYSNKFWILLRGISGSTIWITLFIMSEKWLSSTKIGQIMSRYGTMTLGIYVLQTIVLEIALREMICFDCVNWVLFSLLIAPIISLLVMMLCVAVIEAIRKNEFLTLVILGDKK